MKFKIALLLFILFSSGFAQKTLDKVVAVIDNEIILQSELEFQVNMFATQRGIDPSTPGLKNQHLHLSNRVKPG